MRRLLWGILFVSNTVYASNVCTPLFDQEAKASASKAKLEKIISDSADGIEALTFKSYQDLASRNEIIGRLFKEKEIVEILADQEINARVQSLSKLLNAISETTVETLTEAQIKDVMKSQLHNRVPADSIDLRISDFLSQKENSIARALGQVTLKELQLLTYGKNHLKPSPESLLGQYIARTGAKTVARKFSYGAEKPGQFGPEKLVISLSDQSYPVYKELFSISNFLLQFHTPRQGTLIMGQSNKVGSYGSNNTEMSQYMTQNESLLPHILLTTTEASRATNFFLLGAGQASNIYAQHPWRLLNKEGESYCARGGYSSCTHWVGNIPLGDKKVAAYAFPGRVDNHADGDVPSGVQKKDLIDYVIPENYGGDKNLLSLVWKTPGNQTLSDLLGLSENNIAGEFASPGYVAVSLTALAPVERVPFVFRVVPDHTVEIDPNFVDHINAF